MTGRANSTIVDFAPVKESRIGELAARFDIVLDLATHAGAGNFRVKSGLTTH
jgi:hypothetical protein